jgi:hypothetical protein
LKEKDKWKKRCYLIIRSSIENAENAFLIRITVQEVSVQFTKKKERLYVKGKIKYQQSRDITDSDIIERPRTSIYSVKTLYSLVLITCSSYSIFKRYQRAIFYNKSYLTEFFRI